MAWVVFLCAALTRLEGDRALRCRLGEEGRRRILGAFTVAGMAAAHDGLYRRLAAPFLAEPIR